MGRKFLCTVAAVLGIACLSTAEARELRLAIGAPEMSPFGQLINEWRDRLAELSDNKLTVQAFFGAVLGDEQTTIRQAVRGRLDIAAVSTTAQTLVVPEYALVGEPFLFANAEERYCVEDNHIDAIYGERFSDAGLVRLGFADLGFEMIFSQEPVSVPADLVGLKMRVPPTTAHERFAAEAGASVVFSGITEIIPGLKAGAVDAVTTTTVGGLAIGIPDIAPNMTNLGAIQTSGSLMMSKTTWESLSGVERTWLETATSDIFPGFRELLTGATEFMIGKAIENGATLYQPSEAELELWHAVADKSRKAGIDALNPQGAQDWKALERAVSACRG